MLKYATSLLLSAVCFVGPAQSEALSDEKRALIDSMLQITESADLVNKFKTMVTSRILTQFADKNGEVDKGLAMMVEQEVSTVLYEDFILSNKLKDISYSLYDEYFSLEKMRKIVAFFESEAGETFYTSVPKIASETIARSEEIGQKSVKRIEQRIAEKLASFRTRKEQQVQKQETAKDAK